MKLDYYKNKLKELLLNISNKEVPVAALIVKDGNIIAKATNLKETLNDATSHAEINAVRKAGTILNNWYLNDTTLITTLEPCPMCLYAIIEARVKEVVYFVKDEKNGAINSPYSVLSRINPKKMPLITYLYDNEFELLLKDFFKKLRK